jgi:hypothetical protein
LANKGEDEEFVEFITPVELYKNIVMFLNPLSRSIALALIKTNLRETNE